MPRSRIASCSMNVSPNLRKIDIVPSRNISLADLAVGNFIEMRDKTASRLFRAKKKLDHFLEAALPGIYLPLYTMVTFTRIPYARAARRARIQDTIVYVALLALLLAAIALLLCH